MTVTELGLLPAPCVPILVLTFFQLFMARVIHHLLSNALVAFLCNMALVYLLLSHRSFDLLLHLLHLSCLLFWQVLINFLDSAGLDSRTPLGMRRHSPFASLYLRRAIGPIQINLLIVVIVYSTASSLIFQKAFLGGSRTSTRNVPAAERV